jgi:hypothetical protein
MIVSSEFFLEWEMFQTKVVKKIKTHISCSVKSPPENRAVYDRVAKCGRAGQATNDKIIGRMRFACWIPKGTNTHSEYVILTAFTLQQRPHERASMLTFIRRLPVLYKYTMIQRFRDGRNTALGIATRYGLDGTGFEPRWGGRDFRTLPDRPRGPTTLLYDGYRVSSSRVKRPERGANSAEVKNGWCYTSTSPLWLLGMLRDSFVWKLLGGELRSPFVSDKTWQIPRGIWRVCGKSIRKNRVALSTQLRHIIIIIIIIIIYCNWVFTRWQ